MTEFMMTESVMKKFTSIVVLTGAGISAESGLKTFRDANGLWENHRVEDVASPEAFSRNPELVYRFYNLRRMQLLNEANANAAHAALAKFEQRFSGEFTLITQNVDDLHERAGSKPLHMHGEILKARCTQSSEVFTWNGELDQSHKCACCNKAGQLRPHIVWFGEVPFYMQLIMEKLSQCDLFISIGTSGHVYPAAGFYEVAKQAGAHTVELNLEPSANGSMFDEVHYGKATELLSKYFDENF